MRAALAVVLLTLTLTAISAAEARGVEGLPDSCVAQVDIAIHRSVEEFADGFRTCDWVCGPSEQQRWARELLRHAQARPLLSSYLATIAGERGFSLGGWTTGLSPPEHQKQKEVYGFRRRSMASSCCFSSGIPI